MLWFYLLVAAIYIVSVLSWFSLMKTTGECDMNVFKLGWTGPFAWVMLGLVMAWSVIQYVYKASKR